MIVFSLLLEYVNLLVPSDMSPKMSELENASQTQNIWKPLFTSKQTVSIHKIREVVKIFHHSNFKKQVRLDSNLNLWTVHMSPQIVQAISHPPSFLRTNWKGRQ